MFIMVIWMEIYINKVYIYGGMIIEYYIGVKMCKLKL